MSRPISLLLVAVVLLSTSFARLPADAAPAVAFAPVSFAGDIGENADLSGAAVVRHGAETYLVVGSDETNYVQVLRQTGNGFEVLPGGGKILLNDSGHEIDIEGVAAVGATVYVTGSHSLVRNIGPKGGGGVKPVRTDEGGSRKHFFRFTLGPDGRPVGAIEKKSLADILAADAILGPFTAIASKENGIDIEGLAEKVGRLHFGFRGPVLRDNWVPVLSCEFDKPAATKKLAYVQLGGRGIRDLLAIEDGFLILAGPVGDGDGTFRLYRWNGNDALTSGRLEDTATMLLELPLVSGSVTKNGKTRMAVGKPEGITVLGHDAGSKRYTLLLLCDGLDNGKPQTFTVTLP